MNTKNVDRTKITPMMRQYLEIKDENKDVIILFRLGDFYEAFFEDAVLVSRELELTLTGRSAGLSEKVPMCGVPYHAVNVYIEKLIEKGYRVGICEQLEDPKESTGIVKRGLTQIISKGTVIDSESLVENEFNYIGNIVNFDNNYFLCYMDITTGIIYITKTDYNNIISEIVSLGLKEVVVSSSIDAQIVALLKKDNKIFVTYSDKIDDNKEYEYIYEDINDVLMCETIKHLLTYVTNSKMMQLTHLQKAIVKENNKYLKMDIHTKRNLELTETLRLKQRQYSLLWLLDKTKTAMGSRLLKTYIENPLIDKNEINKRYDMVEKLQDEFILAEDLKNLLYHVYDLERLSGRIAFNNANARDLLQLKSSLHVLPDIKNILEALNFKKIDDLSELYDLLEKSIYENPPVTVREGYLIKGGYNKELDELKNLRTNGKDFIAKFEASEREKTGIKTLKVGYNRVFGYYIEVSKGMKNLVKDSYGYERKQTLSNCERYISPILKEKESIILNAEEKIIDLEYELFCEIKNKIKLYIPKLQSVAKIISEIDVLLSFATISTENNYIRPILLDENRINILDNRHAVVENVLDGEYVKNDIIMDENTNILLITGPNMAGKSTYMRQLAITIIMAQIGCFVPASEASMMIFSAIYTRIGASDDLVSGKSTFMVEMSEANNAIQNADKNSLILFDELGRGTATYDGMALAYAIIEYIHNNIGCKTLFSTHYHELTQLENKLKNLKNVHVSAYEENGKITFLHKIKDGSIDKSYGIHVARLALLPDELIKRAEQILLQYENKNEQKIVQESLPLEPEKSVVEKEIKNINLSNITPIEALNILYKLQKKL